MAIEQPVHVQDFEEALPHVSEVSRFLRVFLGRKIVVLGFILIALLAVAVFFAPLIAPHDPYKTNLTNVLAGPSVQHWLGTDQLGRDTLSRIVYGSRNALLVGVVAVGGATICGMFLGLLAGYFGGFVNLIVMRAMDALMTIPMILLAITISAVLGGGLENVMIAIGVALVPPYTRLMCGQVLSIKQNDYIIASRAIGAKHWRIMFSHIVPNCFPPLIVLFTLQMGHAILSEASLSFLGVGIAPPEAAWGSMVSQGYAHLLTAPILSISPGIAIMLVVFAFNMVGDGLRDALDPRLRGTL